MLTEEEYANELEALVVKSWRVPLRVVIQGLQVEHECGIITNAEFHAAKSTLMANMPRSNQTTNIGSNNTGSLPAIEQKLEVDIQAEP